MERVCQALPAGRPQLALCYIRQSYTRDDRLMNSADRQSANVLALCEQQGWTPLWFVEAEGHRSASREENRPEWLRLKEWLANPQVVAVVANDPSRLYRKMWRMGSLLETLDACHVQLRFASPGSPVRDIRHPTDRFILQMYALMDENYVHDMARRQKDNIAFRRAQGKTTGLPPFGVVRNAQGYLMPSPWGAWVFGDGRAVTGQPHEEPPDEGSDWRGYYDCAYHILTRYAQGDLGRAKLARRLDDEGWRFKDRWGEPRRLGEDDIRRVVSNWAEYGGMVGQRRAKDCGVDTGQPAAIPFVPERAVFPLELLREVVAMLQSRNTHPVRGSRPPRGELLALTGLCYCAHCDALAGPTLEAPHRTRLGSLCSPDAPVYRHRSSSRCNTTLHSLPAPTLEREVGRLIDLLIPDEATWQRRMRSVAATLSQPDSTTHRQRVAQAVADCEERFARAKQLYLGLAIDEAEYRTYQAQYRQDLEQLRIASSASSAQLAYCRAKLVTLQTAWQSGSVSEQRGLVRSLFQELVVDLDRCRITAFRLKTWLHDYLHVCAACLVGLDQPRVSALNLPESDLCQTILARLYPPSAHPAPVPARVIQQARNESLRRRYADGETLSDLARDFGFSPQRAHQIVHEHRK